MAKNVLPTQYLGTAVTVTSGNLVINLDNGASATQLGGGLTAAESTQTAVTLTTGGALTAGLTYTVTTAQTGAAPTLAEWNTMGWNGTAVPVVGDTFTALTTGAVAATGSPAPVVTSGDVRRILMGIVEAAYQKYQTYSTAGTAPAKMFVGRSSSINDTTGILTRNYTLTFQTDISSVEVTEE